jgi:hypothetical protein
LQFILYFYFKLRKTYILKSVQKIRQDFEDYLSSILYIFGLLRTFNFPILIINSIIFFFCILFSGRNVKVETPLLYGLAHVELLILFMYVLLYGIGLFIFIIFFLKININT